jgi:hypothetical protein
MTRDVDRHIEWRQAAGRGLLSFSLSCLLALLSVWNSNARAENGRDYSAMYDIGPATALDPTHVSVKLFLRLQNHSGTDLTNATITLADRLMPGKAGMLLKSGVTVAYRSIAKVSGTVTVGSEEYARWQRGGQPSLVIRVPDRNGRQVDRPIELVRMPGVGAMP